MRGFSGQAYQAVVRYLGRTGAGTFIKDYKSMSGLDCVPREPEEDGEQRLDLLVEALER